MNRMNERGEQRMHEMPHELIMDELEFEVDNLSAIIQTELRRFDVMYEKAYADGFIDDEEEKSLITLSYKIAEMIRKDHPRQDTGSSNVALGIVVGIGIAIVGIFGINKLNQT